MVIAIGEFVECVQCERAKPYYSGKPGAYLCRECHELNANRAMRPRDASYLTQPFTELKPTHRKNR